MKINRNSWHYKLNRFGRSGYYDDWNLCAYIRGMIRGVLLGLWIGFLGSVVLTFLVSPLIALFTWWPMPLVGIGLVVYVCMAVVAIVMGINKLRIRLRRNRAAVYVEKQPGPIRQYLKDKHSKVCRLLSYEGQGRGY